MITAVAAIAPLCVVGVALTAASWWEGVVIASGLLLVLGVLRQWNLDGYPRRAVLALLFTGTNWLVGALLTSNPFNFVPFALIGALRVARLTGRRRVAAVGFALGAALIGCAALVPRPPTWALAATYVALPLLGTLFVVGVIIAGEQAWLVVRRLQRAQRAEAELAVARERVRFAGDLHDIQGHSLHVVKLKAAIAARSVRTEPGRAEAELAEIRRLVDDTIGRARDLAHAHHDLNLATELANAQRIGAAAGISVEVSHDVGDGAPPHPLLAQVLREAMTNLLRHAHPTRVSITASTTRVEITNDGVRDGPDPAGPPRGLARLRDRVERAGGRLATTWTPGGFAVVADVPSPRTDPPTTDHGPQP